MINPSQFFDLGLVGIAAGSACAGIPTISTCWQKGNLPSEPGFSVGLVLLYVPAAYGIGGALGLLVPGSNALVNALLLSLVAVVAHWGYLARKSALSVSTAHRVGIDAHRDHNALESFSSLDDSLLATTLEADLKKARFAQIISPESRALLQGNWEMSRVLRRCAKDGATYRVLSDKSMGVDPTGLRDLGVRETVGGGVVHLPPFLLALLVDSSIYFSFVPSARLEDVKLLYRADLSHQNAASSIAGTVASVASSLLSNTGASSLGEIVTASSQKEYRDRIVPAEAGARSVKRLPKRLSVMFKSEQTVTEIAKQRFGPGSTSVEAYVAEHASRRQEFFHALGIGMHCKEIYSERELIRYVRERKHGSTVVLSLEHMRNTVVRWREAVRAYDNYIVGITSDPLPLKYELIDQQLVVMHEAIGVNDSHRLNSVFLSSSVSGAAFDRDFETIWDRIPLERRGRDGVLKFIEDVLMPLCQVEGEST